jgi:pyridoxine kinase
MAYQRILTVQDISCLGQCSITVALPILSACGHETCILPSAVLSTHTGGFGMPHIKDLTEDFEGILSHWQEQKFTFDAVYTGYLGNTTHMEYVKKIFDSLLIPGGARIVDPAMGDHGKLYTGFDLNYALAMRDLCASADVILPNVTEACFMTGTPYRQELDEDYVSNLMDKLEVLCPNVVLTGIGYKSDETGVLVSQNGKRWHYVHKKIPKSFHGTGDVFASAFVGAVASGLSMERAAGVAAEYTALCIRKTYDDPSHWYGVKFEAALGQLIAMLEAGSNS